jgi:hypothetical protein
MLKDEGMGAENGCITIDDPNQQTKSNSIAIGEGKEGKVGNEEANFTSRDERCCRIVE